MPVTDSIYFIAFCIFLFGAALHLRGIKKSYTLWVMSLGVIIDFYATIIPSDGFKSLAINIGASTAILTGITLEIIVWCLFLAAVFIRLMGRFPLFYFMITVIKVLWFIDLISFIYGVYPAYYQ